MAPSAIATEPSSSTFQDELNLPEFSISNSEHPVYLQNAASNILHNLQYQHDWTSLAIHTHSSKNAPLPRPVVSGLPPRRAYIHPDEQIEILKAEHETGKTIEQISEQEWVLPTHWQEKWSLSKFATVFDALDTVPPTSEEAEEDDTEAVGHKWQGKNRQKRLLLATIHDDSTVVYYIMHDGIVKPRQN